MYSNIIINMNGLNIMVTLYVYFEYIKILYTIFTKYIAPILQVYQKYFIILLKSITTENYYYYFILFINVIFKLIFHIILIKIRK